MKIDDQELLTVESLIIQTKTGRILAKDISFSVGPGEFFLVTGPNGVGKTTLLRLLLGRQKPLFGRITNRLAPGKHAYLPQLLNSAFHLPITIGELLQLGGPGLEWRKRVLDWGLFDERHFDLSFVEASGGERKRALLSRVLLSSPDMIILDEPFHHLDIPSKAKMVEALTTYIQEPQSRRAAIVVSHELPFLTPPVSLKIGRLALDSNMLGEET